MAESRSVKFLGLYEKTPENIRRLLGALQELKARYRDPAGRHIEPDVTKLETLRTHLLVTDLGPLDVFFTVGNGLSYQDLVARTVPYELGDARIRVLELAAPERWYSGQVRSSGARSTS